MPETPKYRVIRKLEAGGMAEVFQAEVESIEGFKKQVAIKRVLPHLAQHRKFIEMFLDEARLSLKFSHMNVAQTFSIGVADNTYFITMEFIEGVNIRKIMEYYDRLGVTMDPAHAAFIVNDVCKGLSYAHNLKGQDGKPLGVVHRDVSPPNVLISRQGEVKLVDFGLAKATSQLENTDPGLIKGKFAYLSPEAAHGLEVDKRSDIFAAGTVLWELLTGRRLFKGETDYDTVMNVRDAPIPPVRKFKPNVPPEMDSILAKALSRDLAKRYQDASEMGRDLMQLLFMKQMAVTSYDIAKVVETIIDSEPKVVSREVDIIDRLIEDEMARLTSLEAADNPFGEGDKPILSSELSGMLGGPMGGALEDPRQWGLDLGSDLGDSIDAPVKEPSTAGGWRESRVYDLSMPADGDSSSGQAPAQPQGRTGSQAGPPRAAPPVPRGGAQGARPVPARQSSLPQAQAQRFDVAPAGKGGSRVGLWLALGAVVLAAAGAAALWFLVYNR